MAPSRRVWLAEPALDVLCEARKLDDGSDLVFPSPTRQGQTPSDMTLTKILRTTGLADRATVHGFHSSFRHRDSENTPAPRVVMELSLARRIRSYVEEASARSDLLDLRRALMKGWGKFVAGGMGEGSTRLN